MKRAPEFSMNLGRSFPLWKSVLASLALAALVAFPVWANEKGGMPDLSQEEQTCLPTSTANLIVWFGLHGYPKLIAPDDSEDDGYIHTVHRLITAVDARYDLGTRTDAITYGISKYIHDAGYDCDVEYRGLDWSQAKYPEIVKDSDDDKYKQYAKTPAPFTQDWLKDNDDPNKGFILLLAYVNFDRNNNVFTDAYNAGHAVTLVNAEPDMLLIHDPAHYEDEPGRKIVTPTPLTGGVFSLPGYNAPVAGLMLLSGSILEAPENAGVMLTGAVCVTMHPVGTAAPSMVASSAGAAGPATMGSAPSSTPAGPVTPAAPTSPAPQSTAKSWTEWLFDLCFGK